MDNKNLNDGLRENLPDFIMDRIEDKELISRIKIRIESDSDFRTEYEEIKSAVSFLNSAVLTPPPHNYFSNLSVKINRRIEEKNKKPGFFTDPLFIFKKLIPALGLLIVTVYFIFSYLSKDANNTVTSDKEIIKTDTVSKTSETPLNNVKSPEELSKISNPEKTDKNKKNELTSSTVKNKTSIPFANEINSGEIYKSNEAKSSDKKSDNSGNENPNSGEQFADNILSYDDFDSEETDIEAEDEDFIYQAGIDDNENLEEELLQLSAKDKNEILENLKKSKTL